MHFLCGLLKSACQVKISDCVANFADAFSPRVLDTVKIATLSSEQLVPTEAGKRLD